MPKEIKTDITSIESDITSSISTSPQEAPAPLPERHEEEGTPYGLTVEEVADPNSIGVTISERCPIVILFGAKTSGKTMMLIRLTRYLRDTGRYTVEPDRIFRQGNRKYIDMCNKFDETVTNNYTAAEGTSGIGFMLITVRDRRSARPICQILEAPGEHFFNENDVNAPFPPYICNIVENRDIRRTWLFITELFDVDSRFQTYHEMYSDRIANLANNGIPQQDKVIFVCNKADKSPTLFNRGRPINDRFFAALQNRYGGAIGAYRNHNPITSVFRPYDFDFVVFSAGQFNNTQNGETFYTPSNEYYPEQLWKAIEKNIQGRWF